MHDEMITLFDDCIADMMLLRAQLAASRRVEPGERHTTVLAAIAAAERFAVQADQTLAPVRGTKVTFAPVTTLCIPAPAVGLPAPAPAVALPASASAGGRAVSSSVGAPSQD